MTVLPPFQQLLDQEGNDIYSYLRRLVGIDRADDCFQETFLRALQAYPQLVHSDNLRGWLFRIARNIAVDEFRQPQTLPIVNDLRSTIDDPGRVDRLVELIAPLPERQRLAISWRFLGQLSYREIAQEMDSREDTARRAVADGLNSLRAQLRDDSNARSSTDNKPIITTEKTIHTTR